MNLIVGRQKGKASQILDVAQHGVPFQDRAIKCRHH